MNEKICINCGQLLELQYRNITGQKYSARQATGNYYCPNINCIRYLLLQIPQTELNK